MENLINFLKELFTKPMICWSATDYIIIAILFVACLCIFCVVLGAICGFINWLKKRRKRK